FPLFEHEDDVKDRGSPVGEIADDGGDDDRRGRGEDEPLPARNPPASARLPVVLGHESPGGSVWESNPSTVCLERSTGFEVREAHRVPRRFRYERCFV